MIDFRFVAMNDFEITCCTRQNFQSQIGKWVDAQLIRRNERERVRADTFPVYAQVIYIQMENRCHILPKEYFRVHFSVGSFAIPKDSLRHPAHTAISTKSIGFLGRTLMSRKGWR